MKTVLLGDICNLMTGGTPSKSQPIYFGGDIKWLVSGDIHQGEIFDCGGRITEAGLKNSNARFLPEGSVMIALNGQGKTRGTVAMLRTKATCNQSLVSIYPKDPSRLLPEFIYQNLKGRYEEIRRMTGDTGNERRGLNMKLIASINIPEPPCIEEQRNIVKKLDEAFEKIDKAKANTEKNLKNAQELFDSESSAIFSKKNISWHTATIGDLYIVERGGSPRPIKSYLTDATDGINWIKIGDVKPGARFITQTKEKIKPSGLSKTRIVKEGDFVLSNSMSFGRPYIMKIKGAIHDGWLLIHSKDNKIKDEFLYYFLSSRFAYKQLDSAATGSTVRNLKTDSVRNVTINYPRSPNDQQQVIDKLDALSEQTRKLEEFYQKKLNFLEELKQSILKQAFSGEL